MKTLYTPEKLAKDAEMAAVFRQKQALPYEQKVLHAAQRAREFYNEVDNVHVSVGGLDSITLLLFLRNIHIDCPAISVSCLEDKSMPAAVDGTLRVFQRQKLKADREQAERTAWRNVRDWVLAQVALIESCDVPIDQVFLPYLTDGNGQTLYQAYLSGQLLLGEG